jgi:hypothetical protein
MHFVSITLHLRKLCDSGKGAKHSQREGKHGHSSGHIRLEKSPMESVVTPSLGAWINQFQSHETMQASTGFDENLRAGPARNRS